MYENLIIFLGKPADVAGMDRCAAKTKFREKSLTFLTRSHLGTKKEHNHVIAKREKRQNSKVPKCELVRNVRDISLNLALAEIER